MLDKKKVSLKNLSMASLPLNIINLFMLSTTSYVNMAKTGTTDEYFEENHQAGSNFLVVDLSMSLSLFPFSYFS